MLAACLGVFIAQVSKAKACKSACASIGIMGGLQLAGAARLIRLNEYHPMFLSAAEAVARNSRPHSLLIASNEMWFGLWRDH